MLVLVLGASSCSDKTNEDAPREHNATLEVVSEINTLRASETSWDKGDKIGLYVVESGKGLAAANIYQGASNLSYVTSNGDGRFAPTTGSQLPLLEGKRVDVISYYPHQEVGGDYKIKLNVGDQSDLPKLDLLYSSNARAIDARAPRANLVFDHVMSQLQLNVLAGTGVDLSGLKVRIGGVITEGVFDPTIGKVASLGTTTKEVVASSESGGSVQRAILIPGQKLNDLKLTFEIGGKSYVYDKLPQRAMQSGVRDRFTFQINEGGLMLVNSTIEVIGKGDEGSVPGVEVPGGSELPVETKVINLTADDNAPHSIGVFANDGEVWSATASAPFVHMTTASGTGRGALSFYLDKNTSTVPRTTEIKVVGKGREVVITITQAAAGAVVPGGYSNTASYMEQVLIKNGSMKDMLFVQHDVPDNWFAGGSTPGGKRRNYSIYYSKDSYQPYMISYPLYKDCVGGVGRNEKWDYDPELPANVQMDLSRSYTGNYSRGHMLASNNRTASVSLNWTTFYYSNMVPQNQNQNGGIWNVLENVENNWAQNASKTDTLYVVCGPTLASNLGYVTDRNGSKRCPIPTHTWKVLLKKKKSGDWVSIGVKMPNNKRPKGDKWTNHILTVAELEKELGVTFFPQLDPAIAEQVKSQRNTSDW